MSATPICFDMVLFGGGGDLTMRKLLPGLYRAFVEGKLDPESRILCLVRGEEKRSAYKQTADEALREFLNKEEYVEEKATAFAQLVHPLDIDIVNRDERWQLMQDTLTGGDERSRVFYLAIPPAIYGSACENLHAQGLITENSRVVVEKPIGYDGETAAEINNKINEYFPEQSIFRIDHYLGKETVQNLMALRFSNVLFEQFWDAKSIDHVQISISETVGLESRAGFYDKAGALRDMVQNHILQLLCLVAMESPPKLSAHGIRAEKLKVLESLRPLVGEDVALHTVRGQYVAGDNNGQLVPGYLEELGEGTSRTETFVAIRAYIDNWRWARVPFFLRTGKRMAKRCAEIVIQFKEVSHNVYPSSVGNLQPNRLVIRLQPDETVQLQLMAKDLNKLDMELKPVTLDLNFAEEYEGFNSDAYKRLMLDAAENNPSLFIHRDEVDQAWAWIDPIIEAWRESDELPQLYRAGSWGPQAATELMKRDDCRWHNAGEG